MSELDDLVARLRDIEPTLQPTPRARAVDARLLAPAIAAWAGALAVLLGSGWLDGPGQRRLAVVVAVIVAAVAVAVVVGVLARRASRGVGLTASLGLAAGIVAAALQVQALNADPVAAWASTGRNADVVAEITSEPLPSAGPAWQTQGQSLVRMRTLTVAVDDEHVRVDLPAVVGMPSDAVARAPIGTRVRLRGSLHATSSTDAAFMLRARDVRVERPPGPVDAAANALRAGLVRALEPVDPGAASLVNGLAVGGTALMPALLEQDMRTVGLSHLTAVSGGNVSIILGAILLIAGLLRAPLGVRIALAVLGLGFFIVLVRPQPSVVRAAVMGAIAVIAMSTGGRRSGPSVLAVAVLVLVVLSPPLAVSWGFALSVMATAGIVLLAPAIEERLRLPHAPPVVVKAVALTTAAQLMTAPLIVAMGATIGWVALPANLLAAPAVAPVTILGLLAALASVVSPSLAGALAAVAAVPAAWVAWVAQWTASLPGAVAPIPPGATGVLMLAALAVMSVVAVKMARMGGPRPLHRRLSGVLAVALVIVVAIVVVANTRGRMPDGWLLIACDVGQGDALVLRSAAGSTVLVDAGPDPTTVDRCLTDAGVGAIDVVVLSHYDSDHIGGLAGALHGRNVAKVIVSPVTDEAERVDDVRALLAALVVVPARQGMQVTLDGLTMQVLWPAGVPSGSGSVQNDGSVVVLADVDGVTMLLTGDIEQAAQAKVARLVPVSGVDVVKVPHHGSANLDPALAAATHPRVAVFSVGADNDYGHPTQKALSVWASTGAVLARTDEQGALAVIKEPDGTLALATTH